MEQTWAIGGTLVHMANGTLKNIEDVVVGDEVLSIDTTVEGGWSGQTATVGEVNINVFDGTAIKMIDFNSGKKIILFDQTKLLIKDKNFVAASNLVVGDIAFNQWGDEDAITQISDIDTDHGLVTDDAGGNVCGLHAVSGISDKTNIVIDSVVVSTSIDG